MNNEVIKSEISNEDNSNDEYSIWNFLKERVSLLIACVSAVIAIFSFFFNMTIYLNIYTYLSFWEVNILHVKYDTANQLYNIILAFLFQLLTLSTTYLISNTYDAYGQRQKIYILIKHNLKKAKKDSKALGKKLAKEKKEVLKLKRFSKNEGLIKEQFERIECVEKEYSTNKEIIAEVNDSYKKIKKRNIRLLIVSDVICFLIMFVGCFIFIPSAYTGNHLFVALIFAFLYVGVNTLLYGIINSILIHCSEKKKEKIDVNECADIISKFIDYPIERIFLGQAGTIVSNKIIQKVGVQLIIAIIVFLGVFSYSGHLEAKNQKEFYCISNEEDLYVVIYNTGEDLILKRAYIDNELVTIDLSVQKMISAKDVVLCKKKFSDVEVIRIE